MADNVHELRPKAGGDTEKITINLGYVDLDHLICELEPLLLPSGWMLTGC